MCTHILEVVYRNRTEPDQRIPFDDAETMEKRMKELSDLDTVESLTVFRPSVTHRRISSWQVTQHE